MVTVRLSEPPTLSVTTDFTALNTMPTRRSLFGPEYTPTPISARSSHTRETDTIEEEDEEAAEEEEERRSRESDGDVSPQATAKGSKNLLQELNDSAQDDEEQEEDQEEESNEVKDKQVARRDSIGSDTEEEVNWDELQKKEDEQAQDRDDNVSFYPVPDRFSQDSAARWSK